MILWDIIGKYGYGPDPDVVILKQVMKIPNGDPLPETKTGHWERLTVAISRDEAEHLLNSQYEGITQPKC